MSDDQELIPLRTALSFWETEEFNDLTIYMHQRFIHHLAKGHVVIEGAALDCNGNQSSISPIPSDVFRRTFEFEPSGPELRALAKDGQAITYRDLSIRSDHLNALRSLMEDVKRGDLRQELFDRIATGIITPMDAEAEAGSRGIGPLNSTPGLSVLDPMKERRWTFAMALAWILWRDSARVQSFWPKWLSQAYDWKYVPARKDVSAETPKGLALVPVRGSGCVAEVVLTAESELNDQLQCSILDALEQLWAGLERGEHDPDGVDQCNGKVVSIDKREFRNLSINPNPEGDDCVTSINGMVLFVRPTLDRESIIKHWPQPSAESRCLSWLIEEMEKNKTVRPQARDNFKKQAMREYGISGRAFGTLWKEAIKTTGSEWDKPGRPQKNPDA